MKRFRNHQYFGQAEAGQLYEQGAKGLLSFRAESALFVYWIAPNDPLDPEPLGVEERPETLVGYGVEPFEVEMPPGHFRISCEGRAWVSEQGKPQFSLAPSDEVFTTLDRPAPLSPEMAAIARLMRQNQQDREEFRGRLENAERANIAIRRDRAGRTDSGVVDDDPKSGSEDGDEPKRGKTPAKKRADPEAKEPPSDAADQTGDRKEDP